MPLTSVNISSGAIPASEGVIQSLVAVTVAPDGRVRIRGHVNVTGNASAGTITVNVRRGTTISGLQVYTSGAITYGAAATGQIVFEAEDDANWVFTNGNYVITAADSAGAGTLNGGYVEIEILE